MDDSESISSAISNVAFKRFIDSKLNFAARFEPRLAFFHFEIPQLHKRIVNIH